MSSINQPPRPPPPPQISIGSQSLQNSSQATELLSFPAPPTPQPVQDALTEPSYPDFTNEEALLNPRKYSGYRVFSRFIASDQALFIVRRFGTLNARVLLAMQDELAALEDKLNFMDKAYSRREISEDVDNGTLRDDPFKDREELVMQVLPEKLARYNRFINEYSQILARPPVREGDIQNVQRWLAPSAPNTEQDLKANPLPYLGPIDDLEAAFITHHDDLVGVQPKSRSWFRNVLESTLILRTPVLRSFFERHPDEYETINTNPNAKTIWQNDGRVEHLSSGMIAIVGLGMLVGPLWILKIYENETTQLGIITGFIVLFFVLVAVATTAKVFDALAAAAAYSAVLMVFLQLGSSSGTAAGHL